MDGSDWIVILIGAVFVPAFMIGLFMSRRVRREISAPLRIEPVTTQYEGVLGDEQRARDIAREVAGGMPGCTVSEHGGLRFIHRGLEGRLDFISDKTEITVATKDHVRQVVEIVPTGILSNLFPADAQDRMRARGSKAEYDRIFKGPAEEHLLMEIGTRYELRLSPGGMSFRLHALPPSAAMLGFWLACAYRLIDLIVGFDARIQLGEVADTLGEETTCQVCGSSLATGGVVHCVACRTPHHDGCWQYTEKCSTFGCGSLRFVR